MPVSAKAIILNSMLIISYACGAFVADDLNISHAGEMAWNLLNATYVESAQNASGDDSVSEEDAAKLVVQSARSRPKLSISNQNVEDMHGVAIIKEAVSIGPGWLVIYNDCNAHPDRPTHAQGLIVGRTSLDEGLNENVRVKLNMAFITPKLYAVVHEDSGKAGIFEYPGPDSPCALSSRGGVTRQFYSTWPYPKIEFPKHVMSTGRYLEPP